MTIHGEDVKALSVVDQETGEVIFHLQDDMFYTLEGEECFLFYDEKPKLEEKDGLVYLDSFRFKI